MRKFTVGLVAALAVLGMASPADAIHHGRVRRTFAGPDGAGGANLNADLVVDDHDFEDKIRGMVLLYNTGNTRAVVHISYLKLIKSGVGDVRVLGQGQVTVDEDLSIAIPTTWLNNPHGVYHSRTRIWVCWPFLPGDPCGNPVAWNSGDQGYI